MNQEKQSTIPDRREGLSERERLEIQEAAAERIHEKLERKSSEKRTDAEDASREALEHAHELKKESHASTREKQPHHNHLPSKQDRARAYETVMDDVRSHLSPSSRAFSKTIHNPVVEKTSEAVGGTIARPNALLAGGVSAFIVSLAVYLIARHYGYPLSGSESIATFAAGWIIGVVFDFIRLMITGKRS